MGVHLGETMVAKWICCSKEWELEKETKVNSEFLLMKSSESYFISLPAIYLII